MGWVKKLFCTHYWVRDHGVRYYDGEYREWRCKKCNKVKWKPLLWLPINFIYGSENHDHGE